MKKINAAVLARELDRMRVRYLGATELTGLLSQMEEQTMRLVGARPQLKAAHDAFATARQNVHPRRVTPESLLRMEQAASELIEAVRRLGNVDFTLCGRPTYASKACQHALQDNGRCAYDWHTD